jgi:hypothetical protein
MLMVKTRRLHIPLALLLGLIPASALAGEKKDFDARWKDAEQIGKYATHMTPSLRLPLAISGFR